MLVLVSLIKNKPKVLATFAILKVKNFYMMNKVFIVFIGLFLLASCSSSHYLKKAQFDQAIAVAVKKVRKNPSKEKEISQLKYAYSKANQIDNDRLAFLFESGNENIWDEVHQRYAKLYRRQELVKTLPDNVLAQIDYLEDNYGQKLSESKKNAAEYHYQKGLQLLEKGSKYEARDAYENFNRAKHYYSNYKDVNIKIDEAKFIGTNHVLFRIINRSNIVVPEEFESELLKISLKDLNQKWIDYDTHASKTTPYDFYIQLTLKEILVSPNNVANQEYKEEKEIEDGFKYLLDERGNVKKDTLGNDIKLPVYRIINCTVRETHQHKEAKITGTIDYIETANKQLVKTHPVSATMVFDHHSAEAFGDIEALSPESKKKVKSKPLPFPTNAQIIMDASYQLKNNTKTIIYNNRNWLQK